VNGNGYLAAIKLDDGHGARANVAGLIARFIAHFHDDAHEVVISLEGAGAEVNPHGFPHGSQPRNP
jgi:hypothetical protein